MRWCAATLLSQSHPFVLYFFFAEVTVRLPVVLYYALFSFPLSGLAQTSVVSSAGTTNTVLKFSDAASTVPSNVTDNGSVVSFSLDGTVGVEMAPSSVGDYSQLIGGKFGAGGHLIVQASSVTDTSATGALVFLGGSSRGDALKSKVILNGKGVPGGTFLTGLLVNAAGNTGLGIAYSADPGARLEVNGSILQTSGTGASLTLADGSVQSTAWNGVLCGGDYAEAVDVPEMGRTYAPGDLLMIDVQHPGRFVKLSAPYSTLVAGVYATKPGVTGHRHPGSPVDGSEIPMAMVGIVPLKVTTENGSISAGDLLVASSTPGYAMKGSNQALLAGAVIGKALGNLPSSQGSIEVLLKLQ